MEIDAGTEDGFLSVCFCFTFLLHDFFPLSYVEDGPNYYYKWCH